MHASPLRSVLLLLASLVLLAAWPATAANSYKIAVDSGVTQLELEGLTLRVETTGSVILYLQVDDGAVTGTVESVGGGSASVTITLLGPPDQVIFRGRVGRGNIFAEYYPRETGQGEM